MIITLIIVAAVLVIFGLLILIGKGDNLIAGYNTASEEERAQYNVKRLRGLIGGLLVVLAPMMLLMHDENSMAGTWAFISLSTVLCIIVLVLANTWAKKK